MAKFDLQNKKIITERQNNSKYCGLSLRRCNVHLRLRKYEKLPQTYRKLADMRLRNTSCSFAEFAVAELSLNLRCPALQIAIASIAEILHQWEITKSC